MLIERIEGRQLLSASHPFVPGQFGPVKVVQNGSVLTVNNAHDVQIREPVDGTIVVADQSSPTTVFTTYTNVSSLVVNGTKGGDIIFVTVYTVNTTVNGLHGGDEIGVTNSNRANIVVNAGPGDDTLAGQNEGPGTIVINGGSGRDTFTKFGTGPVTFNP